MLWPASLFNKQMTWAQIGSLADDAIYRVVCEIYCDENFLFLLKKCQFISIRKSCNPAIMTLTLHPQSINECIVMQWHGAHSSTEIFNLVSFSGSLQQNNNQVSRPDHLQPTIEITEVENQKCEKKVVSVQKQFSNFFVHALLKYR